MAVIRYSVIVPVYKNEATIPRLVETLGKMNKNLAGQLEAVFVVDGSPDDSFIRLREILDNVTFSSQLLLHSRNFGSFAAIRTGLASAKGRMFAVMAADLQEPPELVLSMFRSLDRDECDVAIGVRNSRSDALVNRVASSMFWSIYRRLVVREIPPGGVDIFGCNEDFRTQLLKLGEARSSLVVLIFWLGFRRKFLYYDRLPRMEGKSAWTLRKKIDYMLDSMFAFTDLPINILLVTGAIGIVISFLLAVAVILGRLLGWISVQGYAATMLTLLFFGSVNILGFGIVGAYVWRAYENSKGRPLAIVARRYYFGINADIGKQEQEQEQEYQDQGVFSPDGVEED